MRETWRKTAKSGCFRVVGFQDVTIYTYIINTDLIYNTKMHTYLLQRIIAFKYILI